MQKYFRMKVHQPILPEKLEFDRKYYRTARMNTAAYYTFQMNNELHPNKNRTNNQFDHLSCLVPTKQLITNQIYLDFKKLYDLKPVLEEAGLYPLHHNKQSYKGT